MGLHDDSIRTANQMLYGVDTQFEANLVRRQEQLGFNAGPAYGAGIGNLSGWVVFFGAIGLIVAGITTRNWIGGAIGAVAGAAIPTGIAILAGKFRPSLPRLGASEGAKQRKPRGVLFWIGLFGILGGLAGAGFAYAIDLADAVWELGGLFAGAGAVFGLVVGTLLLVFRRRPPK